jgi:parallel beta-helix repeat protein
LRIVLSPAHGSNHREMIQAALDECWRQGGGEVILSPGTYLMDAIFQHGEGAIGSISLLMRNRVSLKGEGPNSIIKAIPNCYGVGAFHRIIGTLPTTPVSDVTISDLTIDGDRLSQIPNRQASNILLDCQDRVKICNIYSINANGNGVLLCGALDRPATELQITDCQIRDSSYIGIQASQFRGCDISRNAVTNTGDNGIDIYGEAGTTFSHASLFTIQNNHVSGSTIGIFVETSRDGTVRDNVVVGCAQVGVAVNRINGEPRNVSIEKNDLQAPIGVKITGDTGGISISKNLFRDFSDCAVLLGEGGNVSHVSIIDNRLRASRPDAVAIRVGGLQAAFLSANHNRRDGGKLMHKLVDTKARSLIALRLDTVFN